MDCVSVKEAKYIEDYKILIVFNTNESGIADLSDVIDKYEIAKVLKDTQKFAAFHLDSWPTIAWDCGFDIAPETLYYKATGKL